MGTFVFANCRLSGEKSLPTVIAIVRSAFGRHAWTMQLRHQSRSHMASLLMFSSLNIAMICHCTVTMVHIFHYHNVFTLDVIGGISTVATAWNVALLCVCIDNGLISFFHLTPLC